MLHCVLQQLQPCQGHAIMSLRDGLDVRLAFSTKPLQHLLFLVHRVLRMPNLLVLHV